MKKLIAVILLMAGLTASLHAQERTAGVRFAWGAGVVSSIDMTSHDMSSIGMEAYMGIRAPGVQFLGLGTSMNISVNNSQRYLPIYFNARTSFTTRPTLCFMDVRGGLSVNYLEDNKNKTGEYMSVGIGFNLASKSTFTSHLIAAYTYHARGEYTDADERIKLADLHMATIRLGITF